jgi:hypothetical protein
VPAFQALPLQEQEEVRATHAAALRVGEQFAAYADSSFGPTGEAKTSNAALQRSSAAECRRMSQSAKLDEAAATSGPSVHECGTQAAGVLAQLMQTVTDSTVILRASCESPVPPHTGQSVALLPKTSYGALEQTAAGEGIRAQAATSVLQLRDEVEKTLTAANLEATFETFYLSDDPDTLQKRRQNRAKVVVSFTEGGGAGGHTVLSKLSETYLEGPTTGPGVAALDKSRSESVAKRDFYRCGGAGTVLILTPSSNSRWLHGWKLVGVSTTGCRDHQDWCSWDTLVLAFAVSNDGVRVLVQLTMRVRGEGGAEAAASCLRANLFGAQIAAEAAAPA